MVWYRIVNIDSGYLYVAGIPYMDGISQYLSWFCFCITAFCKHCFPGIEPDRGIYWYISGGTVWIRIGLWFIGIPGKRRTGGMIPAAITIIYPGGIDDRHRIGEVIHHSYDEAAGNIRRAYGNVRDRPAELTGGIGCDAPFGAHKLRIP